MVYVLDTVYILRPPVYKDHTLLVLWVILIYRFLDENGLKILMNILGAMRTEGNNWNFVSIQGVLGLTLYTES